MKGELNIIGLDKLFDDFMDLFDNTITDPNVGDPYVPGDPITIVIDGETMVVTGDTTFTTADGTVIVVTLSGQPPVVVVDGESTEVTTDKLDFDNPSVVTGEIANRPVADTTKHSINYLEFKAYQNPNANNFGFDAYPKTLPQLIKEYDKKKVLNQDYIVPWQSAEANGKPAWVNMHIQTKIPDSIQTRLKVEMNGQSLTFSPSPDGDTIRVLSLTGQENKSKDLITANYINDKGEEIPVGYLNMVSYQRQNLKLMIVPVDGEFNYTGPALQNYLNRVYGPAITNWEAGVDNKLNVTYDEGEANGLNTSRTFFSSFNH